MSTAQTDMIVLRCPCNIGRSLSADDLNWWIKDSVQFVDVFPRNEVVELTRLCGTKSTFYCVKMRILLEFRSELLHMVENHS